MTQLTEGEIIRAYKNAVSYLGAAKFSDYAPKDFEPLLIEKNLPQLRQYLQQLEKRTKALTRAAELRELHYQLYSKDNEDKDHRYARNKMKEYAQDAKKMHAYYSEKHDQILADSFKNISPMTNPKIKNKHNNVKGDSPTSRRTKEERVRKSQKSREPKPKYKMSPKPSSSFDDLIDDFMTSDVGEINYEQILWNNLHDKSMVEKLFIPNLVRRFSEGQSKANLYEFNYDRYNNMIRALSTCFLWIPEFVKIYREEVYKIDSINPEMDMNNMLVRYAVWLADRHTIFFIETDLMFMIAILLINENSRGKDMMLYDATSEIISEILDTERMQTMIRSNFYSFVINSMMFQNGKLLIFLEPIQKALKSYLNLPYDIDDRSRTLINDSPCWINALIWLNTGSTFQVENFPLNIYCRQTDITKYNYTHLLTIPKISTHEILDLSKSVSIDIELFWTSLTYIELYAGHINTGWLLYKIDATPIYFDDYIGNAISDSSYTEDMKDWLDTKISAIEVRDHRALCLYYLLHNVKFTQKEWTEIFDQWTSILC